MTDFASESVLQSGLSVVFQPIVELAGPRLVLHGVESLSRACVNGIALPADALFASVREQGAETVVDRWCIANALSKAGGFPPSLKLSFNVHASTLASDETFPEFIRVRADECQIQMTRLVAEIIEHTPPFRVRSLFRALDRLRSLGVSIALDDVGSGDSNFRKIVDCRPDYFKIDRYLVTDAHLDRYRHAVLESLARLAERLHARVVAEGVEDYLETQALLATGIDLAQGYFFCPPLSVDELDRIGWLRLASEKTWRLPDLESGSGLELGEEEQHDRCAEEDPAC